MHRLVYSPKAFVYVETDLNGLINLSEYVVSGNVNRKINQVSTAEVTIRNPYRKFTQPGKPTFHPMDRITIWLQRLPGHPVQVFTGYLDRAPYYQLYPGTCTLTASCTLKRLEYTFWDPALPFMADFMEAYHWEANFVNGTLMGPVGGGTDELGQEKQRNASIAELLFAVLKHVGNWDEKQIFIEDLPPDLLPRLGQLMAALQEENSEVEKHLNNFLEAIVGAGAIGSGGDDSSAGRTGSVAGADKIVPILTQTAHKYNLPPAFVTAVALTESGGHWDHIKTAHTHGNFYGYFQFNVGTACYGNAGISDKPSIKDAEDLGYASDLFCRAARNRKRANQSFADEANWWKWGATTQLGSTNTSGNETFGAGPFSNTVSKAKGLVEKYGDGTDAADKPKKTKSKDKADTVKAAGKKRLPAHPDRPGAKSGDNSKDSTPAHPKIYAPIGVKGEVRSPFGEKRSYEIHHGTDYAVPAGTACIAPADGEITQWAGQGGASAFGGHGGMVQFRFTDDVGDIQKGTVIGWGHVVNIKVHPHQKVKAGDHIADSNHPAPHVHWIQRADDSKVDGDRDGWPLLKALMKGETSPTAGGDGGDSGGGTDLTPGAFGLAVYLDFPSAEEQAIAQNLPYNRSLMNDRPLLPFVEQLSQGSLRQFQSAPDGTFYAFFPDYFGSFGKKAYWEIDDIEILDGKIELTDESLATHVFIVGDTMGVGTENITNKLMSTGVVNVFNAGLGDFINHNPSQTKEAALQAKADNKEKAKKDSPQDQAVAPFLGNYEEVLAFLKRYGARPYYDEAPFIRSHYFETFIAMQTFMLMWARQFLTTFTFTFMPEIYPGGLVSFPSHGFQCYVDEVIHNFDYQDGFTTQANLSAPSALQGTTNAIARGMVMSSVFDNPVGDPVPDTNDPEGR